MLARYAGLYTVPPGYSEDVMQQYVRLVILALAFLVVGCDEQMNAEEVAVDFFQAIYLDNDVARAKQHSDPELRKLLEHYHTPRMVQRHVIGLSMNHPKIGVAHTTSDFLKKLAKEVVVKIRLKGELDGTIREDDRSIVVIKRGAEWKVNEVKPDIFLSNG